MIQLHVDLEAGDGASLERVFADTFSPAIRKQPGFTDVRLLRLRGQDGEFNYRLQIVFETEDQRQAWVATELHQKVWPQVEATLKEAKYAVRLYDVV